MASIKDLHIRIFHAFQHYICSPAIGIRRYTRTVYSLLPVEGCIISKWSAYLVFFIMEGCQIRYYELLNCFDIISIFITMMVII